MDIAEKGKYFSSHDNHPPCPCSSFTRGFQSGLFLQQSANKRGAMEEKDFRLMKGKDLRSLYEKEGIPANTSNSKMVEALCQVRQRPWADLPKEILDLFLQQLSLGDHIRFGAVCKTWRSASKDKPHRRALKWPWLVLPQIEDKLSLYSPMEAQTHDLNISISPGFECLGHSMGWLVIYNESKDYYLLNPLNNQTLELPSSHCDFLHSPSQDNSDGVPEFSNDHHQNMLEFDNPHINSETDGDSESDYETNSENSSDFSDNDHQYMQEFVNPHIYSDSDSDGEDGYEDNGESGSDNEVADDLGDDDYRFFQWAIVFDIPYSLGLAALARSGGLYMCRPGDEEWLVLIENFTGACACYRGSLYCVGLFQWSNVVMCYSLSDIEPIFLWRKTISLPEVCTERPSETYLVESNSGDLLLVVRTVDIIDNENHNVGTTGFHLFRLDHASDKWVQIKSLHNEVLFVSSSGDSCARAFFADDPSGYKANHIYFTDTDAGILLRGDNPNRYYDQGVFSLEDGGIVQSPKLDSYRLSNTPFWYYPKV
ncbi:uncharacterized protein LOC109836380 [Asparagus officinalis]|uniref:uncharacterized protein LOC109836380 n=1 Tax=Asparagus officinalis TaxID=4686 RepID=UPI00098E3369|nr:uncharacterized protein LOC109836380 [Asparagus officinalis]